MELRIQLSVLLLVWWLFLFICDSQGQLIVCPQGCNCSVLSASCYGDNYTFANAIKELPEDIESLDFTMLGQTPRSHVSIGINNDGLKRFWNLRSFKIQSDPREDHPSLSGAAKEDLFCNWTRLEAIHINVFTELAGDLHTTSFDCLQRLQVFDLSYTQRIYHKSLRALLSARLSRHITTLLLRHIQTFTANETSVVDFTQLFSSLNRSSIEILDLSGNSITGVSPGLLLFPNLRKIDLSENFFFSLSSSHMQVELTLIEGIIFHPSLREVSVANQGISYQVRGGRSVDLKAITSPSHTSDCLFGLAIPIGKHLRVFNGSGFAKYSRPYYNILPRGRYCFNPDNNIHTIDLSNNQLNNFIDDPTLANLSITGMINLKFLSFENNNLKLENVKLFDAMTSLQQLHLGGNEVQIQKDHANEMFRSLGNIRVIDLSRNGIYTLPYAEFASLSKLEHLDLSGNKLHSFNIQLPDSMNFTMLNISGNGLTFLKESTTQQLDRYIDLKVDLGDNSFLCSCSTLGFIGWVQKTLVNLTKKESLYCISGKGRIPIVMLNLRKFSKDCHPLTTFQVSLVTACVTLSFILLLGLVVFVVQQRWKIRRYMYRQRLRREHPELTDEYEYHAYISNSDETRELRSWVNNLMQEELETRRNLRLFLKQRDLPVGDVYATMDGATQKCRKIVLVLSSEFLNSPECQYETLKAYARRVTKDGNAVVLIKLKPLPVGIPSTLASLMQTTECLTWTEDPNGQDFFWDQLTDKLLSPPANPIPD